MMLWVPRRGLTLIAALGLTLATHRAWGEPEEPASPVAEGDPEAADASDPPKSDEGNPLTRMRERYPSPDENEYERYPMGLGIERQPERLWLLPIINYTSDLGAGYGLLATWKVYDPDQGSSQGVRAAFFYSALQAGRARLQWERTPGPRGVHLLADGSWTQVYQQPYFGIGNTVAPTAPDLPGLSATEQAAVDPFYTRYTSRDSYVALIAQKGLGDSKRRGFAALRLRQFTVTPFDRERVAAETGVDPGAGYQSLLEATSPYGVSGGLSPLIQLGGMVDSRKVNIAPSSGAFHEFSVRGMSYHPWEGFGVSASPVIYGGVNLTLRRYVSIFGNWVLASRLVGDAMVGEVPLPDLSLFGAVDPYSGLGGTLAGRGLVLDHYIGKVKILWGPELRYTALSRPVDAGTMDLSFAIFADSGRVWREWEKDGEGAGLHTGIGAGVRLIWSKRLLVRLDVAKSVQDRDPLGVYLVFGHPY